MDRQLIRVEFPPVQAGITAALRRAFAEKPRQDTHEQQFEDLLRRLN